MPPRNKHILGKLEMLIMQTVWTRGEATVQQVRDDIAKKRDLAYSTVLTMMRKMEQKGLLDHRTENRKFIYRPTVEQRDVERHMLRDLLQTVFGGSHRQFVNALVEHENLSLDELRRLIDETDPSEVSDKET